MKPRLHLLASLLLALPFALSAQQANPPRSQVEKSTPARQVTPSERPERPPNEATQDARPEEEQREAERANPVSEQPQGAAPNFHFDMTEVPPSVTHHEIHVDGKLLRYTATAGRLPIKNQSGRTEALMFYVAYTLDGADPATRPLTFAFNGGPGSASIWLHMGALGPRKVVLT